MRGEAVPLPSPAASAVPVGGAKEALTRAEEVPAAACSPGLAVAPVAGEMEGARGVAVGALGVAVRVEPEEGVPACPLPVGKWVD